MLMFRSASLFERHDHSSSPLSNYWGPKDLEIGAEEWVEKMAITCIGGPDLDRRTARNLVAKLYLTQCDFCPVHWIFAS
jgi:hypothetical protein